MKKKQKHLDPNQKRTLTIEQINAMTLPDLFLASNQCRLIDDPDWTYLMVLHLFRVAYSLVDSNNLDLDAILSDL